MAEEGEEEGEEVAVVPVETTAGSLGSLSPSYSLVAFAAPAALARIQPKIGQVGLKPMSNEGEEGISWQDIKAGSRIKPPPPNLTKTAQIKLPTRAPCNQTE